MPVGESNYISFLKIIYRGKIRLVPYLTPMKAKLIVHGGAWNIPESLEAAHLAGVRRAAQEAGALLAQGASALDTVEAAVNILEADSTFDAGRGAFLNERGEIELDAMIMDGRDLRFGAVAAVQNILHPVSLARRVMAHTEHCFLVGGGAQAFARKAGIAEVDPRELLTERERVYYEQIRHDPDFHTRLPFDDHPMDTVGAVALDGAGNLAAATSTGGTPRKLAGRVGDSPVVGAGAYADNHCGAVSATGWGESILKVLLSKTVCDLMATHNASEAARQGIERLARRVNGLGGVIGIDRHGEYAFAYNTPKMAFAYLRAPGEVVVSIKR